MVSTCMRAVECGGRACVAQGVRQVAFEVASRLSWVSHAYVPLRPARMPAGASLVRP